MIVPSSYFGTHVLGPLESNINGSGTALAWPSWMPTSIRLLNTYGYSPQQKIYSGLWWGGINTAQGVYDWTIFDAVITKLKAKGVTDLIYSFQGVPRWAGPSPDGDLPPTNYQYLTDFAVAVARRAIAQGLPIRYWEAWNEPNSAKGYWLGTMSEMVTLAKTVYTAVKSVDPTYQVLTPAPQGNSSTWMDGYLAAGGGQYADVMAFHGYTSAAPEAIEALIASYKTVFARYGQGKKPIWDTEAMDLLAGTDAAGHARFLAVNYLLHWVNSVERFYWYSYADDKGAQWDYRTGLNAVGRADIQVRSWMLGATAGQLAKAGTVYSLPLTKDGVTSLAVWNSAGTSTFNPSPYTKAIDLNGTTRPTGLAVTIGQAPILLTAPVVVTPPTPTPPPAFGIGSKVQVQGTIVAGPATVNGVNWWYISSDNGSAGWRLQSDLKLIP